MGLGPAQVLGAGAAGFAVAGIPGAAIGVASAVVSAFADDRLPRIDTFAGTPKGPLEIPFFNTMLQFRRALGRIATEERIQKFPQALRARQRNDQVVWDRAGTVIIQQIFNQADVATIQEILGRPVEEILAQRRLLEEAGDLIAQSMGEEEMVRNVVTGQEQGPSMIDRGRINEGLGNELVSQPQARAIAPLVVPTIDVARFIPHERIIGNAIQRSNTVIGPGPVGDQTLILIPGRDSQQIFIRSVQVDVSPRLTGGTPQWIMRARAVVPGTTGTVLSHFFHERNDSIMTRGESIVSQIEPSFTVPEGYDYIILFELFGLRDVRVSLNVDGIFIPVGVNGSKC